MVGMTTAILDPIVTDVARVLSVPRQAPADSFVLHAPLELMARVGLLPLVHPDARPDAVARIGTLGELYEATGPGVTPSGPVRYERHEDAAVALADAVDRADLDAVDAAAVWLTDHAAHGEIRHLLGEAVVDSLAAAGHAPIGMHLLPRVAGGTLPGGLLRGPLRELARQPGWRLRWFRSFPETIPATMDADSATLAEALRRVPMLGRPGSDFIFPLMSQAEDSGVAARVLGPVLAASPSTVTARRELARAAVWSMLHDDPSQAPYGWSHCLTMPQGVMSLAGDGVTPGTAIAVAATFVVGFRAAHGTIELPALGDTDGGDITGPPPTIEALATFAALHEDAHLVKYTLACLHAAEADPAWRPTYLAAAAYLADWWQKSVA